jgi:hypothetical protein
MSNTLLISVIHRKIEAQHTNCIQGTTLQTGMLQENSRKEQFGLDITDPDDRLVIVQVGN